MTPGILRRASMLAFVGGLVPLSVWGTTLASGTTVSAVAGDDNNYSTTTDVTFQTYCSWIVNGMGQAPFNANGNLPVAFAGYGVAADVPNISSADLSVSSYAPWVVNNNGNAGGNGIVAPDGTNYNRSLTGVEGGGANIVLTYTPTSDFDPTSVNFIQAYIENVNGGAFTTGTIDSTSNSAYYNDVGVFGIGDTTGTRNNEPIDIPGGSNAWMLDIPYTCESGPTSNLDCSGGVDDAVTSQTVLFQAFVSQTMNLGGTDYNVLLGGVQWGYTYQSFDMPEPATMAMAGGALLLFWAGRKRFRQV